MCTSPQVGLVWLLRLISSICCSNLRCLAVVGRNEMYGNDSAADSIDDFSAYVSGDVYVDSEVNPKTLWVTVLLRLELTSYSDSFIIFFRYVGNLDISVSEEFVISLFSQIGLVNKCKIIHEVRKISQDSSSPLSKSHQVGLFCSFG